MAHDCLARRLTTPRQAIRYGNALRFALPMMRGEVNVLDQMGIEGLRTLYPELYAAVGDNKELFTLQADPEEYPVFDAPSDFIKDTSELSFSVNEDVIKSMIEIDALAEAARTAAPSVADSDDTVAR
jgi:hypothetical protein